MPDAVLGIGGPDGATNITTPPPPMLTHIPPPPEFSGLPADSARWNRKFGWYRNASQLAMQFNEQQVDTFLYFMSDKAEEVYNSFVFAQGQVKNYPTVVQKFEDYFSTKKNVIFDRTQFHRKVQGDNESALEFITAVTTLGKKCNFRNITEDELIRDKLIAGMKDDVMSMEFQMAPEADCTLEKVIQKMKLAEKVQSQQAIIRNGHQEQPPTIDRFKLIKQKPTRGNQNDTQQSAQRKGKQQQNHQQGTKTKACTKCGKQPSHPYSECPAKTATCRKCKGRGHWEIACRSKKAIKSCQEQDSSFDGHAEQNLYLGSVKRVKSLTSKPWRVKLDLAGVTVDFKLDCGADVTVIGNNVLDKLPNNIEIWPVPVPDTFTGVGNTRLAVRGRFTVCMQWKGIKHKATVYVVPEERDALLGLPEIHAMKLLVPNVSSIKQSNLKPEEEYSQVFEGLGMLEGEYTIKLKESAVPHAVKCPRRIPIPLREGVQKEINEMLASNVIQEVYEPTEWCAPIVAVPKPGAAQPSVRICVDYSKLNEAVLRERHQLPSVDECLAGIGSATIFSKLDARKGYFQIPLSEESKQLTTFMTPWGRFCFNRLPMGLASSGEHFQRRMQEILGGVPGVINHSDDTMVHGTDVEEHDRNLRMVLERFKRAGITLNREKCVIRTKECTFLGHRVSANGLQVMESKVSAILSMPPPQNVTAVRSFLGAVNQCLRFLPNLTNYTGPLRDLCKKDSELEWGEKEEEAFQKVKSLLAKPPVLALYDPKKDTRVSTDASSFGLGALLEQKQKDNVWKPVHFASRALSDAESRYATIEKEALAIAWACYEKFQGYLTGLQTFEIRTDHRPLMSIMGSKPIADLSPRLQRLRMKMLKFTYTITYVPGKQMYGPDCLSRMPCEKASKHMDILEEEEDAICINAMVQSLPMTDKRMEEVREAQNNDALCKEIKSYITNGWPHPSKVKGIVKHYLSYQSELTIMDDLVFKGNRVYVPKSLQMDMLLKLHQGHLGVVKCQARARESVWWPGISRQVREVVEKCLICIQERHNRPEPLIPSDVPEKPWDMIGIDLCQKGTQHYMVIVDYLSNYPLVTNLRSTTAKAVADHLKAKLAEYGRPLVVRTDNGPQFTSAEFAKLKEEWNFHHITSSPHYPKSNGKAEAAVKIAKKIITKETDPLQGLLAYRAAPLECGESPAELFLGRKLRTNLPVTESCLRPKWEDKPETRERMERRREEMKRNHDKHHRTKELPALQLGTRVWMPLEKCYGHVIRESDHPRSYIVRTLKGDLRRNRMHLIPVSDDPGVRTRVPDNPAKVAVDVDCRNPGTTEHHPIQPAVVVDQPEQPADAPAQEAEVEPVPVRAPDRQPVQEADAVPDPSPPPAQEAAVGLRPGPNVERRRSLGRGRGISRSEDIVGPNRAVTASGRKVKPVDRLNL